MSATQPNTNPFIIRSQQRQSDRQGEDERKRDRREVGLSMVTGEQTGRGGNDERMKCESFFPHWCSKNELHVGKRNGMRIALDRQDAAADFKKF